MPVVAISRTQLMVIHDRLMDQMEASLRMTLRDVRDNPADAQLVAWRDLTMDRASYALLLNTIPSTRGVQANCERMLGARDGTLVGIALELYRRQHRNYPDALCDLTPVLLPQIPADRITGDPIKYRLIDGKPVVYSVGADRIDDGGRAAIGKSSPTYAAAQWGVDPERANRGDWILYPPNPAEVDDN